MVIRGVAPGASRLHLPDGVSFLNEEETVFQAMLAGWSMQQLGGRNLKKTSVRGGLARVREFQSFTNEWPWRWSAGDFDEWTTNLVSVKGLANSTLRTYQYAIRAFCDYLCSEHYGWVAECMKRFNTHPTQICHEWNTVSHRQDFEGRPGRRPLTRNELQRFFDRADSLVEECLGSGRKGALPAYRDATLLKVIYAWGLRISEAIELDVTDFYANPQAPEFGRYGMLHIRNGKSSAGSAPKRRSVATLHPWAVEAVQDYVENVWPRLPTNGSAALWVSERGTRLRTRELQERFAYLRDDIGLERVLSPHALRHSYVTHLVESGVDPSFVQEQVGHAYQSTTTIYTGVSGDFSNKMMHEALGKLLPSADPGGTT